VASDQAEALVTAHGRAVYAGGDDLLGLVPVTGALEAARRCRELFVDRTEGLLARRSVSSAVVFFHASFPLQDALARAREALEEAKSRPGKGCLAVVVLRRGGEKATTVLPWRGRGGTDPAGSIQALAAAFAGDLSPRLITDLHGSRHGIADLAHGRLDYGAEVSRLVDRHRGRGLELAAGTALIRAVEPPADRLRAADVAAWVDALDIARFVAQEGR
jgi:CRISPR-associated protein Cmr2